MRRALACVLFVVQKIVEIAAIVFVPLFVPYWVGCFILWVKDCTASIIVTWILGVTSIAVLAGMGVLCFVFFFCVVPELYKANWKLAKKIAGKILPGLFVVVMVVGMVGCGERRAHAEILNDMDKTLLRQAYSCLSFGFHLAKAGYTIEEAEAKLEAIIGPKNQSEETLYDSDMDSNMDEQIVLPTQP